MNTRGPAVIGKLQRVPLREVWKHEARDFTTWLQDNVDVLNEVLDLTLTSAEREQSAGAFSVDLVAEDQGGNTIIIENQLGKSDHDHLGKLVTYLTAIGAKAAIWIVADPKPEHVGAIAWLNESSSASFYLLKVEAVQIEGSPPAPLLTLIVGPSDESRVFGKTKKELLERQIVRKRFWTGLLNNAKEKTKLHAAISPNQYYTWVGTTAGKRGLIFNYIVRQHDAAIELYIDRGRDSKEENEKIFDQLRAHRDEIEQTFGGSLVWQRLDEQRACRIRKDIEVGGYRDESRWPDIQEVMIKSMIALSKALKPYMSRLQV